MKKVILSSLLAVMVLVFSCSKNNDEVLVAKPAVLKTEKVGEFLYKASTNDIESNSTSFETLITLNNKGGLNERPVRCPIMTSSNVILVSTYKTGDCTNGDIELTYEYKIEERVSLANQFVYDFILNFGGTGGIGNFVGNVESTTFVENCPDWDPNGYSNPCPVIRTFRVKFVAPIVYYNMFSNTENIINATCTLQGSITNSVSHNVNLTPPNQYYLTGGGSRIFITSTPGSGVFNIYDQCTILLCMFSNVECPSSRIFKYKSTTIPNAQWVVVPPNISIVQAQQGSYIYEAQLVYSFGTCNVITGTFTVQ
jgi:hypothetical protein